MSDNELQELLELTRENNSMLRRVCAYIDRIESPRYKEERQLTSFLINCAANEMAEMKERMQQQSGNSQLLPYR